MTLGCVSEVVQSVEGMTLGCVSEVVQVLKG